MGAKVVLFREGADEVFGGYLYFHKAPSAEEFHGDGEDGSQRENGKGRAAARISR